MEQLKINPTNREYFDRLVSFADQISEICRKNNVQPVVYGSLAYIFYTQDENIAINDIDFLVQENDFQKITDLVKTIPETTCEPTDYHSIKFFKDGCKIAFDSTDHYLKDIDPKITTVKINGTEFNLVDKETLKLVYRRGVDTIPSKKDAYSYKLQRLQ